MSVARARAGWPRPAAPLLALLAGWAALGIAVLAARVDVDAWVWAGTAIGAIAVLDGVRLLRAQPPTVRRRMPETWPVGAETPVTLVFGDVARTQRLAVFDGHPGDWAVHGLPRRLALKPGVETAVEYTLVPPARGDATFDGTQLRLQSPWRLLDRDVVLGTRQAVRVYPDFAPLARFATFSAEQASRLVGAHLRRRRGEGTDFHQMRDYRVGDSLRQIDWKATARTRRLVSREYQDERNQQVVLMLDTGRRMMARDPGANPGVPTSHFDHVLDAALLVGWLALRQGDAVGLHAAGGDAAWVPPQRGASAIDRLLRASYALQPRPIATDFLAAATDLAIRQRRRALVMLVTNLRDEDLDDVLAAARLLRRRHVVCVASLREAVLDRAMTIEVDDLDGALVAGATAQYLAHRDAAHDALRSHGVLVLDVTADRLPAALVEKYLAVKRDGVL